jgi:N6-L-threonylcarbamoyladenine synthase
MDLESDYFWIPAKAGMTWRRRDMRILGIESSCDDSAAAYLEVVGGKVRRLEYVVATQEIHQKYGGVVPEVAAREHAATVPPLLAALADKVVGKPNGALLGKRVDLIAVTRGPGLVTSLKVGLDTARALAAAWDKKIIGINHIEGHVYSNWLPAETGGPLLGANEKIFPALVLVVSGGHTELLFMKDHCSYQLLGATRDDAAGEAFDKTAKLMGLGYPGGPALSKLAALGDGRVYEFPRPMLHDPHFDFSFAGLKTAVRYFLRDNQDKLGDETFRRNVAASTERAIVDVLVAKTVRAAKEKKARTVLLAGGVAANGPLRRALDKAVKEKLHKAVFVEPLLRYCTDNAAMIAVAAYHRAKKGKFDDWRRMDADPNWELGRESQKRKEKS